jgi:two-component system, NarL family, response regulator DevR
MGEAVSLIVTQLNSLHAAEQNAAILETRVLRQLELEKRLMASIHVVLADDHAVVRKGIRDFLEEGGDIQVVAEAADGEQAKQLIRAHQPDVVILDIRMPKATGIEVTRWIREQAIPVGIIILTAYDDDPFIVAAIQAGANGYVLKNAEADQITAAVRAVYGGQSALSPSITQKLMSHMAGATQPEKLVEPLTEREQEVLQLAASGLTNRGIGLKLKISDRTVQGHLASIYAKLQVGSRTEAVTKALHLNVITLPENDE